MELFVEPDCNDYSKYYTLTIPSVASFTKSRTWNSLIFEEEADEGSINVSSDVEVTVNSFTNNINVTINGAITINKLTLNELIIFNSKPTIKELIYSNDHNDVLFVGVSGI